MEQEKIKHLEFIENIINRMNTNSFQIKGWMITIVSALLALYASGGKYLYIFSATIPTSLFWFLDSYYLLQERKFRELYSDVIASENNVVPFSMNVSKYDKGRCRYISCLLWSKTTTPLYLIIIALLIISGMYLVKM